MDLARLRDPFRDDEIEWKPADFGQKGSDSLLVLAYVTARAIQNRLDEVCEPQNWKVDYEILDAGVLCHLSIRCGPEGEWVTKTDGAPETKIEAFKGGLSSALKRAGYPWGIGRYLYELPDQRAKTYRGKGTPPNVVRRGGIAFYRPDYARAMKEAGLEAPASRVTYEYEDKEREAIQEEASEAARMPRPRPDPNAPLMTAKQNSLVHALLHDLDSDHETFSSWAQRYYKVESVSDLTKDMASHAIAILQARLKARRNEDEAQTFSGEDTPVGVLRQQIEQAIGTIRGWNEKDKKGRPLAYKRFGLDINSVAELEKMLERESDQGKLERVAAGLADLIEGEAGF